jgi:uncharacterized protein (DUF952 family)
MAEEPIFHMCLAAEWSASETPYGGSSQDRQDGFIHFSTAEQLAASAAKHRAGQHDLLLLTVDPGACGTALRWEASRSGALFPHLYGPLPRAAVIRIDPLPLGADGLHLIPAHARPRS